MKKIISALLFFVALNFSVKAQCPSQAQMVMIAEDTNTIFHVGQGNTNNIPASMPCNTQMAFMIYPQLWSNSSASTYQPCIRTRYNLYYTSIRNNLEERYYQNGSFIYNLDPANAPAQRIGGSAPPVSGTALWDFSLYQISTSATHSISVCNRVGGGITTDSISIRDCWRNNTGFIYASNPSFATASPCLTWSDPANSGTLGTVAWSISPAAVWPAFFGYSNGMAYVDPKYLPPATYTVTYTFSTPNGAFNCAPVTANYVFTVTNPYTATWSAPANLCSSSGCVNLPPTISGTAGGSWSGSGVSGTQFCPTTVGAGSWPVTYTVGVSAACGATQTNSITVTATPTLSVAGGTICSGQSITLSNSGSAAGGYAWSPSGGSASSATVSPTSTTVYTLTGTNAGICSSSTTATVNVTTTPTLAVTGGSICSGQNIVLTNSGTAAGSYTWSPSGGGLSSATVSPTSNTTYTLTGANGACTGTTTATVNVTATPTMSISGAAPVCAGGSIVLTGGTAGSYTWSPSGGNAGTATVTPAGNTTYTLTGANGTCTSSATALVNVTPNPTVSITSSGGATICSGQTTTLTAGGATNYTWSPNAGGGNTNPVTVTPGASDTYTVTGESAGCSSTQVITVNVTPTPTVTAIASAPTICAGQSTTITAGGATNYTWMPGGSTANPLPVTPGGTTTYTVTGDNSGCTSTQMVTVTVNPLPTITLNATPSSLCTGQTTTITASGANTYTWSANAGGGTATSVTITPAATDTYTVNATDGNGCTNSNTITVAVGAGATIGIAAATNTVCTGQSVVLTGSGATNYTWTPGNMTTSTVTVTPGANTTYTLTGDNGGCTGTQTVAIGVVTTPTVTPAASSPAICSGITTTLTASGATNYTWMPGGSNASTFTVAPGSTTTYTLIGESNGCTNTNNSVVTINVTPTPTVIANASAGVICGGQSAVLTGSGAGNYTWTPGGMTASTVTVTPGSSTIYTLTGANGTCTATQTVSVGVTPLPNVSASASSGGVICSGQAGGAILTGSGATTYTWSANAGSVISSTATVNPTSTTTYTVTGTTNGCDNTAQVSVTVNPTPTLTVSVSSGTICAGQSTTLNGSGATTYTWMPGGSNNASTPVTPAANTTYTLTGANGSCTATQTVNVTVNPTPTLANTSVLDSAKCGMPTGGVTGINVTGGTPAYTYSWSNGSTNDSLLNVPAGTYTVVVTDANGCVATGASGVYTVPGSLPVTAAITPALTQGQAPLSVTFGNSSVNAVNYTWVFGNGNSSSVQTPPAQTYTTAGIYTVTLLASNGGCWDTASAIVIIDQPTVITIPNIFSPNGDGVNDDFFIFNTGLSSLNCDIFNRWGQRMYTLNAPQAVWDGKTPNGSNASEGTYYYILSAVGVDGKTYTKQGAVTLVK